MTAAISQTDLPGLTPFRGKVRDVYDFGDRLLFIATDRLSAFDWILPTPIPGKGRILSRVSRFWFGLVADRLGIPHHLLGTDPSVLPLPDGADLAMLEGRSQVVRRAEVLPIECVVRGYLAGSGWKEYRASRAVCGVALPDGLVNAAELPEPIFTPATKAEQGEHDENITFDRAADLVGRGTAEELRDLSIRLYTAGREHAAERGILLADTKFEFGRDADGRLTLIDEVLTPDSSRYWPADDYAPGRNPPSYDKQFVRDWLEEYGWDKQSSPPPLPDGIVERTRAKYVEAYERLTGQPFAV